MPRLDDLARSVFRATGAPLALDEAEQIARAVLAALRDDLALLLAEFPIDAYLQCAAQGWGAQTVAPRGGTDVGAAVVAVYERLAALVAETGRDEDERTER